MEIKDRILEFLKKENISSAQFAQEIGVQPSGISHIVSGRNKPSLEFIVKMLKRYQNLSVDWLLFGKGEMLRNSIPSDLFSDTNDTHPDHNIKSRQEVTLDINDIKNGVDESGTGISDLNLSIKSARKSTRIVIFHADGTFSEYLPG